MNISSLVITPRFEADDEALLDALSSVDGLTIEKRLPDGRFIAILERISTREEVDAVEKIQRTAGVASATMAYHHFEDETVDTKTDHT